LTAGHKWEAVADDLGMAITLLRQSLRYAIASMPLRSMTSSKRAEALLGFLLPCSHCATVLTPTAAMAAKMGWLIRVWLISCPTLRSAREIERSASLPVGAISEKPSNQPCIYEVRTQYCKDD
jgi:hypothetical protein